MASDTAGLLFLDTETFNPYHDLRKVGADLYARNAEIILFSYADGDDDVQLWDSSEGDPPPVNALAYDRCHVAHNAYFDRAVLNAVGWCNAPAKHWHCTMAQAYSHAMPGALEALCRYLDVPMELRKKGEGQRLISLFCKLQRNGLRIMPEDRPAEWEAFKHYAYNDTVALREVYRRLPTLNLGPKGPPVERALWLLDQKINRRGFKVDLDLATSALKACAKEKDILDHEISKITKGAITSGTQRGRILERLQELGLPIANLQAATVEGALDNEDLRGEIRALLETRRTVGKASTGKYRKLLEHVGAGDRMRGGLQFAGAKRTARWAGRGFQPHNMPRPKRKLAEIEAGIEALKLGCADLIEPDVHALCSDTLRSLIIAEDGRRLVVADLNAIEGRVLAWLAGETWKLELYRDPDADMYIGTFKRVYGLPDDYELVGEQRQEGKVFELSFGYEGGVLAMIGAAKTYRVSLVKMGAGAWAAAPPEIRRKAVHLHEFAESRNGTHGLPRKLYTQLEAAKLMWRAAAPATVRLWKLYQNAALQAVKHSGTKFSAGRCVFLHRGNYLYCRLPSGRFLMYRNARVRLIESRPTLLYTGDYGGVENMYGGKWAENITQAIARDVLGHGMLAADKDGFGIVLTVHDEIIAEEEKREYSLERLIKIMTKTPAWAEGLPLKAAGYEAVRYKKD